MDKIIPTEKTLFIPYDEYQSLLENLKVLQKAVDNGLTVELFTNARYNHYTVLGNDEVILRMNELNVSLTKRLSNTEKESHSRWVENEKLGREKRALEKELDQKGWFRRLFQKEGKTQL